MDCPDDTRLDACTGCGQAIEGPYLRTKGSSWHPNCFRCASCNNPIGNESYIPSNGQAFHEHCYRRRYFRPCDVCARPLVGGYLTDVWNNAYCPGHRQKLPLCFSCSRLICDRLTRGGKSFSDGRNICHLCYNQAVIHQRAGRRIFTAVRKGMYSLGMDLAEELIPFRMVSGEELQRLQSHRRRTHPTMGMARTRIVRQGRREKQRHMEEVVILFCLPRLHFEAVAAHELCHAWLFFHHFPPLPPLVEEGLCTVCELLWLERHTTEEARVRGRMTRENQDPIYGAGVRAALKALEKRSLPDLLNYVKQRARFPREARERHGIFPLGR